MNKSWKHPNYDKLIKKLDYKYKHGNFNDYIVVTKEENKLIDGYSTYILAKDNGHYIVKVKRVKTKRQKVNKNKSKNKNIIRI